MRPRLLCTMLLCLLLAGCAAPSGAEESPSPSGVRQAIPYSEGQLYAAAYLGYLAPEDLDFYVQTYLDGVRPPVHHLSAGEYYLIIPRYEGMALSLSRALIDAEQPELLYEDPSCSPFVVQCNASDIFADAVIRLTWEGETAEFSPFLSLKDGSVQVGDRGLDLTKPEYAGG